MKVFVHTITAKAFTGFLILAIVFGAGGYFIYSTLDDLDPSVQRIREPNTTVRLWSDANKNSNEAITLMRRYVLSGDTNLLYDFEDKRISITITLDSLRMLADSGSSRLLRVDTLQYLLDRKLEESTFGMASSVAGTEMSLAIDNAVRELAMMERRRQQEMDAGNPETKTVRVPDSNRKTTAVKEDPKKKDNFWQKYFVLKNKNKNKKDTVLSDEQIAHILDSMIIADSVSEPTSKVNADTINRAMIIAEQLSSAKTRDFETREAALKEELRLVEQRRATDSLITELTARMATAEQVATADLIGVASGEVKDSTRKLFIILTIGALALIILFTIVIRNDVSRSNKLRAQIEKARQNAEQLAKTREEFAANMSHEIRSPLNSIMGISEQLSKNPGPGNQKLVEGLLSSSQHLLGLINPVLDVTKLNSGKIEFEIQPFNLHETLADVQRAFRVSAAEKVIALDLSINSNVPLWISGDDVRLRQVLFNLVGNAIKFTDKGQIVISCTDLGPNEDDKHLIQFKVKDTGIGIEASAINRIFDEYSQANSSIARKFGGTGLGLSISRKLIEQQNGSISVKSQPGAGSEFTFEIPYIVQDKKIKSPEEKILLTQQLAAHNILVCDDEEMNRMLAGLIIVNHGGKVMECGSGEEVIEKLQSKDYDLLLLDINLPGMDGKKTLYTLRTLGKTLPVVAVTGNAHEEPALRKAGFSAVIIKPYQEQDLLAVIEKLLTVSSKVTRN